jgi:HTH-type transcriptional regulator / antitoxin HigA
LEKDFMKSNDANLTFAKLPRSYNALCRLLPPRPIHSRSDYQRVTEVADVIAGHDLNTDQQDYFDLLCRLIEDWEQPRVSKPKATSLEVLNSLLEAHQMTPTDFSKLLGVHRTLGPMILRGERKLTLKHVKKLAAHFGLSTDAFID